MRRSAEEARQLLEQLPEKKRKNGPPDRGRMPGFAPEDLRGRVVGSLRVTGFLCTDKVSPWWIVRCVLPRCKAWDTIRGSALRNRRYALVCRNCAGVTATAGARS